MKHSLLSFLFLFTFILFASCIVPDKNDLKRNHKEFNGTIKQTKRRVNQLMRRHHLPGFAITLVDEQGVIYQESFGFADLDKEIICSSNTIYKLWSVSKPITALEIFKEVEEGLIDLDKPITNYLPEFRIKSNFSDDKSITIRNLLAHRSGLPRNECVTIPSRSKQIGMLDLFEESISDCYMAFPVEFRYKYSNLGYDILGRVIEQNRHESYSKYMNQNFLKSIGMNNSTFSSGRISSSEKLAKGYEFYKGKYYPIDQSKDINSVPSGNLYSTIEDLSIFLKAIFSNDIFQNKETLHRMFEDCYSKSKDPETMGLGWKTSLISNGELMVWHDGGPDDGTGALVAFIPDRKLGLAVISNSTNFGGNVSVTMAKEIFQLLLEEKFDLEIDTPKKIKRTSMSEETLQNFEGKYVAFNRVMEVKAKKKKLKGKISGIGLDLIPVGTSTFRITHWTEKVGLTKIIRPPIEFSKLKVEFIPDDTKEYSLMTINLDNISFEICPNYPEIINVPEYWISLSGEYKMAERLPENMAGNITGRYFSVFIDNEVLMMSDPFGPIVAKDDHTIQIVGGPFAGEKVEYNVENGNLIHQNAVLIPIGKNM